MDHRIDVTDDVLILLADILGTCDRVLARAGRDARLARIRRLGSNLHDAVLDHWAELAANEVRDERQLELDLASACDDFGDDRIPF